MFVENDCYENACVYFCFKGVTVILGGKKDGLFQTATDTVETYSPSCGLFDSNLPAMPIAKHSFGATYLNRL